MIQSFLSSSNVAAVSLSLRDVIASREPSVTLPDSRHLALTATRDSLVRCTTRSDLEFRVFQGLEVFLVQRQINLHADATRLFERGQLRTRDVFSFVILVAHNNSLALVPDLNMSVVRGTGSERGRNESLLMIASKYFFTPIFTHNNDCACRDKVRRNQTHFAQNTIDTTAVLFALSLATEEGVAQ